MKTLTTFILTFLFICITTTANALVIETFDEFLPYDHVTETGDLAWSYNTIVPDPIRGGNTLTAFRTLTVESEDYFVWYGADFGTPSVVKIYRDDDLVETYRICTICGGSFITISPCINKMVITSDVTVDIDNFKYDDCEPCQPVPEPGTMFLLGFGMIGLGVTGRRLK